MASEQRLIDAFDLWSKTFICDEVAEVRKFIVNAPTVDAEEIVHGEWLDGYAVHNGKEVYQSIDCSVCEEVFKIESHDREYWKTRFKSCPFCGALMDEVDEDA